MFAFFVLSRPNEAVWKLTEDLILICTKLKSNFLHEIKTQPVFRKLLGSTNTFAVLCKGLQILEHTNMGGLLPMLCLVMFSYHCIMSYDIDS